jgi:hypothetical protein
MAAPLSKDSCTSGGIGNLEGHRHDNQRVEQFQHRPAEGSLQHHRVYSLVGGCPILRFLKGGDFRPAWNADVHLLFVVIGDLKSYFNNGFCKSSEIPAISVSKVMTVPPFST